METKLGTTIILIDGFQLSDDPPLAHRALTIAPEVRWLLPCNSLS
jgi:hypothetical protein